MKQYTQLPDFRTQWGWRRRFLYELLRCYAQRFQGAQWEATQVPAQGAAILACNHLSVIDPILLIVSNQRMISFLVAMEYYAIPWLRPILDLGGSIPVRRDGHDLFALRQAKRNLDAGRVLGLFPEGGIGRSDLQKGLAWLVQNTGAPVVPARVLGVQQYATDWQTWLTRQHPRLRYGVPLHFHRDTCAEEILGATRSAIATLA
ncbi:MAG: 1-acyl-sn-glycerol-3-phosphate acyltransferase [Acidithiobacillus sp.]|nr:1-acyl-sn-glycerol-3-phosphate acyltransferase [Acidithiobacillus sp.]